MYDILQLNGMLVSELRQVAEQLGITGSSKLAKTELIYKILDQQAISSVDEEVEKKKRKPRKSPKKDAPSKPKAPESEEEATKRRRTRKKVVADDSTEDIEEIIENNSDEIENIIAEEATSVPVKEIEETAPVVKNDNSI